MRTQRIGRWVAGLALLFFAGCGRPTPTPAAPPTTVRVASLVPAVTDLLLGVGRGDALVAVSNYDTDPRVTGLPRVGDLLSVDWEQLAGVRPTLMVVQINPDKLPPGLAEKAAGYGIELINVRLNTLGDIRQTLATLQAKLDDGGASWAGRFDARLDAVRARVAGRPPIPTLLALSADATFVAGRGGYLDELLTLAGGENVLPADLPPYPTLDRERLLALRPRKVVMILSNADGRLAKQDVNALAAGLPAAWGTDADDLLVTGDPYALVPGWSVLDLADLMAAALHPPPF